MTDTAASIITGVSAPLAGGRLVIDLDALAENYRALKLLSGSAETAAVVKADAYGLGIAPVARTLWAEGARRFFVALPDEGAALRDVLPEADIFVLNGLFGEEAAGIYREKRLYPVLNSQSDISTWEAHGYDTDRPRPCALHVDTGMNRLGLTFERAQALARENALTGAITPLVVMSHLAAADDPAHPLNAKQFESFQRVRALFQECDSSLCNSAGIFLGGDFPGELTRPGIALYGGAAVNGVKNPMRPVVTAESRIAQVRVIKAGDTVSYGGATVARDTIVAVCSTGYADGYHRSASGALVPLRDASTTPGAYGFIHGRKVPLLGRVTMDLTLFDVTELGPDAVHVGEYVELFGANMPIDDVAKAAGTIAYELLTSLGHRYHRHYVGGAV